MPAPEWRGRRNARRAARASRSRFRGHAVQHFTVVTRDGVALWRTTNHRWDRYWWASLLAGTCLIAAMVSSLNDWDSAMDFHAGLVIWPAGTLLVLLADAAAVFAAAALVTNCTIAVISNPLVLRHVGAVRRWHDADLAAHVAARRLNLRDSGKSGAESPLRG